MILYGQVRTPQIEREIAQAARARAGVVQPNAPTATRKAPPRELVLHTARLVADEHADFVVWPETSIAGVLPAEAPAASLRAQLGESLAAPVIAGALLSRGAPRAVRSTYNAALLLTPQVEIGDLYRKMRPLVFGEYLPWGDEMPSLYDRVPAAGRVAAGPAPTGLDLGGHRVAALVCYEDLLGGFARGVVAATDAELLVSLSNDDWFQSETEARAHAALATFRAIEERRYLVRATNNGPSAVIDPLGRARGETRAGAPAQMVEEVRWMHGRTIFGVVGDAPWWGCAAAVAVALTRGRRRRAGAEVEGVSQPPRGCVGAEACPDR
jgi:apolipoprotein N-acyltransferase